MSEERLTELEANETFADSEEACTWESELEFLNNRMLEETPKLLRKLYEHLWGLANGYEEVLEQAEAAGETKKLRSAMRQNMKPSYRKDLDAALKFRQWVRNVEDDIEIRSPGAALDTMFAEVGLGVGFGLLNKLSDTYTKPNVAAIDIDKRKKVSIAILEELVAGVQVADKGSPKNDIKLAEVGHLIKMHCLPEVGDRIEYDKTIRGVVVETVGGEDGNFDAVMVKIDGSDKEEVLVRGERKIGSEKPAELHEAAIIRGGDPKLDGQTVVVKDWIRKPGGLIEVVREDGTEDKVQGHTVFGEVLLLDGSIQEIPAQDLVKAPAKKSRVVGELLTLVSAGGTLEKLDNAVKEAKLPLLKMIDDLNEVLEKSHDPGIFNDLPLAQRIEIIAKMPRPDKQEIWTQLGAEMSESNSVVVNPERAIEIQASDEVVDWAEVIADISKPISDILPEEQELDSVDRPAEQTSESEDEIDELGF